MKRYQLIKFLSEPKDEATLLSIDRIPRRWVRYDVESGHVLTKFPPPPYTTQTHKLLTLLIETEGDPMPSWPEYPIELVGHADTYEDSMKRLVILEKEPYAFTSDSDTTPNTKAAQILEELKTQSLATIMEVPSIGDQESDKHSDFNLPFESLQQFKEFDIRLQQDEKFRQRCAASLIFYIDPENHVPKSVTNIIKKFISRDVAMNHTAVKQMVKKEVFKNMKFCDIMFEVLTKHHTDNQGNPICAKYFFQCLGHALANSKDWDGFRVERAKKEMTKKRLAEGQTTKN